jgi:hypothetical protein
MCGRWIHLQQVLAAMVVDYELPDCILLNETDWKILRQVRQLLKPFKNAQKLLEVEKFVTLSLLSIAIKSIRTALIKIVGAEGGGEAQNRVKNLAKRLLFDFRERWKPDDASQYLEGDIVTRGRGNWQIGLHLLAAFASKLDPRKKLLKAYSKGGCNMIWAGLHQNAMQHCQLLGGTLPISQHMGRGK